MNRDGVNVRALLTLAEVQALVGFGDRNNRRVDGEEHAPSGLVDTVAFGDDITVCGGLLEQTPRAVANSRVCDTGAVYGGEREHQGQQQPGTDLRSY